MISNAVYEKIDCENHEDKKKNIVPTTNNVIIVERSENSIKTTRMHL